MSLYESDVTEHHPDLVKALNHRQAMSEALSTAKQNYDTAHKACEPLIAKLELGEDAAVRVGDFVISQKLGKSAHVEFERKSSLRTRIRKLDE
jgi:hypothetical protein